MLQLFFESLGQAILNQLYQVRKTLCRKQIDQVVFGDVSREVYHYFLLVGSHEFVLELAKYLEQFEIKSLL